MPLNYKYSGFLEKLPDFWILDTIKFRMLFKDAARKMIWTKYIIGIIDLILDKATIACFIVELLATMKPMTTLLIFNKWTFLTLRS